MASISSPGQEGWQAWAALRWPARVIRWARAAGLVVAVIAGGTLVTAAGLTANLALHNDTAALGGAWSARELLDLGLAMGWLALVVNAGMVAALLVLQAVLSPLAPRLARPRWRFLVAGLPAAHAVWILLNRLPMVQHLVAPPPFVTPIGLAQAGAVLAGALALAWAVHALLDRELARAAVALAASGALVAGVLAWNAREEVRYRAYPMERVQAAAAAAPAPALDPPPASPGARGPVIVLGYDGWGWDVLVPLIEAGRMPNLAALIRQGAVGDLDNGDDSYSPRIWSTIFTGRGVEDHGIHDFVSLRLAGSGRRVPDLVSQTPAIDSFYGLKQLLRKLPSLGLWDLVRVDGRDLRAKPLWTVASDQGRRVVVANAMNSVPTPPVDGAVVDLQGFEREPWAFYPPELADRWQPVTQRPRHRSLADWREILERETDFVLGLLDADHPQLGLYYSKAVDWMGHHHWSFYTGGDPFVSGLPNDLPDAEWEAWVARNADSEGLGAYALLDAELGRFRARLPDATFVLVSDHAWTFSGYAHYGSQDGVVVVSGPRARAGATLDSVRIEDVAPTVLALLDVPLSDELEGRVANEALVEPPAVQHVASYGQGRARTHAEPAPAMDEETLESLAQLGYLR